MAADLRYTVYEYQPRLLNQLCEPGGLIADQRMTARGATLPLTVAWAKDQPARHYRECHGSASTEIAVDIWCSSSAASRTSLSAIFPVSTQTMPRDGTRLNTFVFLPQSGGPRFPVILHRTPYGIAAADAKDKFDYTNAWLPSAAEPMRGSILRGWRNIVARGYVAVYQDCRGRHGSEGEDRVAAQKSARLSIGSFAAL